MQPGERLGGYEVVDQLSGGGMGVVWRAVHGAGEVAIKTVRAADEAQLRAIRAEIRALERVRHPGVVRILGHGVHQGLPWYAMDLLRGTTLREVLTRRFGHPTEGETSTLSTPLVTGGGGEVASGPTERVQVDVDTLSGVLGTFRALCEVLGFLHGEGIVHRDLKPENVFVRPDGAPVLVDFGMAQAGAGAGASRESLDALALTGGTVSYMAPEQVLGDVVDARADLYAVGAMLFEALCGRPPFAGPRAAVVFAKVGQRAPSIDQFASGVPRTLARMLEELLHPDPTARTAHARVIVGVLDALGARPIPVRGGEPRPYVYRPTFQPPGDLPARLVDRAASVSASAGVRLHVRGAAGSGKTRLVVEVAQTLRQRGFQPLSCPCVPAPGSRVAAPLDPLRPLLHALHDRVLAEGDRGDDEVLLRHGALLARFAPELRALPSVANAGEPPELRPDTERVRLYEALVAAVRRSVSTTPTVLVVDDLPFADALTLGFLEALRDEDLPHVALVTTGTDAAPGGAETLALPPLTDGQVRAMIAAMCGSTDAPPALLRVVAERSGGSPFVVAELLREAVRLGVLDRDAAGAWALQDSLLSSLALPSTVAELVDHRLSTVPERAADALRWAAVIGSGSEESLLLARADAAAVDALVAAEVLSVDDRGRLRFASPALAAVVHERIPERTRRELHAAAAAALQPARPGRHVRIARHLREARDPTAFEASLRAGEEALADIAFEQAVDELTHAEALMPPSTPAEVRTRLHLRLGRAWWGAGQAARSREWLALAVTDAGETRPDASLRGILALVGALVAELVRVVRPDRAEEPPPDRAEHHAHLAEVHRHLVYLDILRNDPLGSVASALRASAHGTWGGRRARRASDLATLGVISGFVGVRWLSERYFARAEDRLRRSRDRHDEVLVALARASLALGRGQWAEVHASIDRGEAAAQVVGDAEQLAVLRQLRCTALQLSGRVPDAARTCAEVIASSRSQMPRLWARCVLVDALASLGQVDRALAEARTVLAELGDGDDHATRSNVLAVLAALQLDSGLAAEARLTIEQGTALCRRGSEEAFAVFPYHVHTPAVWLALSARDPGDAGLLAEAERAVEGARRYAARFPIGRPPAHRHRAALLARQGRADDAVAELARADAAARELGMLEQEALAALDLARLAPAEQRTAAIERAATRLRTLGCLRPIRQLPTPDAA